MALIACPKCGHKISSLARFCPKCPQTQSATADTAPQLAEPDISEDEIPENESSRNTVFHANAASCEELHQHEFKPSLDEKIILEGRTFLVKGLFNILDGYAYLTSKRFAVCDDSGVNIVFQAGRTSIVSVEESRHLISKKIILTTISGEEIQIKGQPHAAWYSALVKPQGIADTSKKSKTDLTNGSTGTLDWHYQAAGIKIGPVKEHILVQLIQNNHTIFRNTKVWNSCLPEWKRADETILTIYFSESGASGEDSTSAAKGSRWLRLSLVPQIKLLCRKYF